MSKEEQQRIIEEGLEANLNFLSKLNIKLFYSLISTAICDYLHENPNMNYTEFVGKMIDTLIVAPNAVKQIYGDD